MKKYLSILSFILVFTMSSCLNNDGEQENKQSLNVKCFNKITTTDGSKITEANYYVEFDFIANTVAITTSDNEISSSTYKIVGLSLSASSDKGWYFSSSAPKVTDMQGNVIQSLRITDFYGQYTGTTIKVRYSVNGSSSVYASPIEDKYNYASTLVFSTDEEQPFTWDSATYMLTYKLSDADAKAWAANLTIKNVKFDERMPIVISEMKLENITVTPTAQGLKLAADNIIPIMGSVPQERYSITELQGTVSPNFSISELFLNESVDLTFKCMGKAVQAKAYIYKRN